MKKIGIYGGTFSPPHNGHVGAARAFAEALSLDELLIIPTFTPPHKVFCAEASAEERLEMSRIAFADIPNACVSDIEIRRGGKSYTYLTLEELTGADRELYLLCGTDMLLTLDEWKFAERIFGLATICYVRRESDEAIDIAIKAKLREYENRYSARITEISCNVVEVSSTELRAAIAKGQYSELLPSGVLKFIEERGLYK